MLCQGKSVTRVKKVATNFPSIAALNEVLDKIDLLTPAIKSLESRDRDSQLFDHHLLLMQEPLAVEEFK